MSKNKREDLKSEDVNGFWVHLLYPSTYLNSDEVRLKGPLTKKETVKYIKELLNAGYDNSDITIIQGTEVQFSIQLA